MGKILTVISLLVLLIFNSPSGEVAFEPIVKVNQLELTQGQVLVVKVEGSELRPEGSFLGKKLNFQPYHGDWLEIVGLSYWADTGTHLLEVSIGPDTVITQEIKISKGDFKESYLTVSEEQQKIVQPTAADEEIINRKERDNERVGAAYSNGEKTPLWDQSFIRPTEGWVTTGYGYTRYVNGKLNNRHSGIDIANNLGTPIYAVNRGIVRLAEELLVTGNTVIIDHGAGIYSSYGHQSELLVKVGDMVERGQIIGKMGSTGFSTGSHLHWVMRTVDAYLNPDLFVKNDLLQTINTIIE